MPGGEWTRHPQGVGESGKDRADMHRVASQKLICARGVVLTGCRIQASAAARHNRSPSSTHFVGRRCEQLARGCRCPAQQSKQELGDRRPFASGGSELLLGGHHQTTLLCTSLQLRRTRPPWRGGWSGSCVSLFWWQPVFSWIHLQLCYVDWQRFQRCVHSCTEIQSRAPWAGIIVQHL